MRGETMKDKSKKSTYSTTFGVDPAKDPKGETVCACKRESKLQIEGLGSMRCLSLKSTHFGVDPCFAFPLNGCREWI